MVMTTDEEWKGKQKNNTSPVLAWGRFFTYRRFGYVAPLRDVFAGLLVGDPHPLFGCHYARIESSVDMGDSKKDVNTWQQQLTRFKSK